MNFRILDQATDELADAIARYESIESGLGVRLKQDVKTAVAWIADHAELPRLNFGSLRHLHSESQVIDKIVSNEFEGIAEQDWQ